MLPEQRCIVDISSPSIQLQIKNASYRTVAITDGVRDDIERYLTQSGVLLNAPSDWFQWCNGGPASGLFRARCCDPGSKGHTFTDYADEMKAARKKRKKGRPSVLEPWDFWIYVQRRPEDPVVSPMLRGIAYHFEFVGTFD